MRKLPKRDGEYFRQMIRQERKKKQEKKKMLFIKLARIIFYAFVVYFQ